jgi:GNAT superfamily N-acetyltransferase
MRKASFDRKDGFLLCKAIDGMPRVNATLPIWAFRGGRFLAQDRQSWYEPVRSVDELLVHLRLASTLENAGVPVRARPHVLLSLQLFEAAHRSTTGVIERPKAGERFLFGHVVCPERVSEDGCSVEFWNSWGPNWGHGGHGSVSIDYLNTYFVEAWSQWNACWGPSQWKEKYGDLDDPGKLREVWMLQNPLLKQKLRGTQRGDTWYVETFCGYSPCDESGVEVVQIRNGYGLRMGWAFQCHIRESTVSEIRELFVMPAFRGQGVGGCLEGVLCEMAEAMGSTEIRAIFHEADGGVLANRGAGRRFLNARGYKMHWRNQTGPRAIGIAVKGSLPTERATTAAPME